MTVDASPECNYKWENFSWREKVHAGAYANVYLPFKLSLLSTPIFLFRIGRTICCLSSFRRSACPRTLWARAHFSDTKNHSISCESLWNMSSESLFLPFLFFRALFSVLRTENHSKPFRMTKSPNSSRKMVFSHTKLMFAHHFGDVNLLNRNRRRRKIASWMKWAEFVFVAVSQPQCVGPKANWAKCQMLRSTLPGMPRNSGVRCFGNIAPLFSYFFNGIRVSAQFLKFHRRTHIVMCPHRQAAPYEWVLKKLRSLAHMHTSAQIPTAALFLSH